MKCEKMILNNYEEYYNKDVQVAGPVENGFYIVFERSER